MTGFGREKEGFEKYLRRSSQPVQYRYEDVSYEVTITDVKLFPQAVLDEQMVPVMVSEEYALLLATNQADSMMGHAGMERSDACTQPAASFALADYAAETEDESYCLLWEAMNAAFEQLPNLFPS